METKTAEKIVSDEELEKAFEGTRFGSGTPREILNNSVLKIASGWATGHTVICIMQELGLIGKNQMKSGKLTKKGQLYLWEAYSEGKSL